MMRVVIADGQALVRKGFVALLNGLSNVHVVGEAATGEQAIAVTRTERPDILLVEVVLPGMGGLEVTQRVTQHDNSPAVIALTACSEPPFPAQMLKAGASGYLTKGVELNELELALRRVFTGRRYVCNDIAQDLASYAYNEHMENPFAAVSHREMQITLMVVGCQKVSEISLNLHLSPKTVNSYRYRIFDKLNISSDVELALMAVQHGMVSPLAKGPLAVTRVARPTNPIVNAG